MKSPGINVSTNVSIGVLIDLPTEAKKGLTTLAKVLACFINGEPERMILLYDVFYYTQNRRG